jgi:hypothetical protein
MWSWARVDRIAQLLAAAVLFAVAVYIVHNRYGFIHDWGQAFFWDSRVFAVGGMDMAAGQDPYITDVWAVPFPLPFISPPTFAGILGLIAGVLHGGVFWLFAGLHIVSLALTPWLLTRLFLGRGVTDTVFGYALFLGGFGAYGVTTALAGNFGSTLYLAIFAAMAHGLRTGRWLAFHIAVGCACQVKMPYALFWAIPVMQGGWDWAQLRNAAFAAAAAAIPYVVSYAADPAFFHAWLGALGREVARYDVGLSTYGAVYDGQTPPAGGALPMLAHLAVAGAMFAFLL